jgi:signal transduction histidine kinase
MSTTGAEGATTHARQPRLGPPIALQIIALLVVVLIVGQIATLVVVFVLPPPRPPVYRVEEIAAALKTGGEAPRFAPALTRGFVPEPPKERLSRNGYVADLKVELARLLGVAPDQVRLSVEPHHGPFSFDQGGLRFRPRLRQPHSSEEMMEDRPPPEEDHFTPPTAPDGAAARAQERGAEPMASGAPPPWYFPERRGTPPERMGLVVGTMEAAYQVQPGRWAVVRSPPERFPNAWQRRMLLWFLACLLLLTPAGYLFARRLTAPIRRFAIAADQLGRDPRAPAMALSGPAEIGLAAAAFNEMQSRLARYVGDRTAMIAAIAHDLRTPLARIQFKLQRAPDDLAADIRSDLGQMEEMIAAVLAFVRDAAPTQERIPLDLMSLLEVVADDAAAMGADVEVEPGPSLVVEGGASALQRLFVNLVDNAVKYGGSARLQISQEGGDVVVRVSDTGPGLPEAEWERVFDPFYRVETSRSRDTGGIGLGLSVARTIARAHGGDVTLCAGAPGLIVVVRLPSSTPRRLNSASHTQHA